MMRHRHLSPTVNFYKGFGHMSKSAEWWMLNWVRNLRKSAPSPLLTQFQQQQPWQDGDEVPHEVQDVDAGVVVVK